MAERLWAITPDALSSLDAMLASSNGKDTAPAPRAAATASHGGGPLLYAVREGVAIIDISGTIHRYGDPEWDAVGHDTIKAAVSLAMRDRSAMDSPCLPVVINTSCSSGSFFICSISIRVFSGTFK